MSATITPYGRQLLLSAVFMPDVYSPPSGLWLAYTRGVPVANSDGSQLDEPTSGYARAAVGSLNSNNWAWTGFAEVYNTNQVFFDAATADWGLIGGWALCDTGGVGTGDCLAVGAQIEPFQVLSGDSPYVDVAGLSFGLYD